MGCCDLPRIAAFVSMSGADFRVELDVFADIKMVDHFIEILLHFRLAWVTLFPPPV